MLLFITLYMLCTYRGSGQFVDCPAQTMDPCFAQHSMDCPHKLRIHTLPNIKSGATTKGTGRNRRKGLPSAPQGDVRDSYLGLGILHCSF